jgi:hypothetical protein
LAFRNLYIKELRSILPKLAAVLSLLIITLIWIGASFFLVLLRVKWDEFRAKEDFSLSPTMLNITGNSLWMYGLAVIFLLVLVQFTFLCGQLVAKFKWLVMFCAFFGGLWLVLRISPLLSNLLQWTPDILFGGRDADVVYFHSGPFIVLLLISMGLVALSGYILEKEVEV